MRRTLTSLILCVLAFGFSAAAQQTVNSVAQKREWKRFVGDNGEFSVALPANTDVWIDPTGITISNPRDRRSQIFLGDLRSIRAFENGVAFLLERYQSKNAKTALAYLLAAQAVNDNYKGRDAGESEPQTKDFAVGKIVGRQSLDDNPQRFIMRLWLASDKYVYAVTVGARDKNNESLAAFLASLQIAGKQLLSQPANSETNALENARISDLQSSAPQMSKEKNADNSGDKSEVKTDENAAKIAAENKKEEKNASGSIVSDIEPLIVLTQPKPGYTEEARKNGITGRVRLRVTFSANGQIRNVSVNQGLQRGLTEKAVSAARRILFLPAQKQGTPISVAKIIEYNFSMY